MKADTITPDFTINLNTCTPGFPDCSTTSTDPNGSGDWEPGQDFTTEFNVEESTEGFTENQFTPPTCRHHWHCYDDPSMIVNKGGHSVPFPPESGEISANENGGGFFDFFNNTGGPIDNLFFTTPINPSLTYTCQSDIFQFCGFMQEGSTLDILFANPIDPIPPVPEPSTGILFLTAAGALIAGRKVRSRRV
ncbi:MAG TPA: PEP-CTERM sorting domain-containing protein [Bryobacteraceae bacterium]|nr:PEP-CTERM sorting domain-containing protein [Bryobacteraceae bacterium]